MQRGILKQKKRLDKEKNKKKLGLYPFPYVSDQRNSRIFW